MNFVRLFTILLLAAIFGGSIPAQTGKTGPKAGSPAAAVLIDINRATAGELKTLPGIGDAYSNAIIKNRPYKNKTQLRSKDVIPSATYEKIKDKIIARQ